MEFASKQIICYVRTDLQGNLNLWIVQHRSVTVYTDYLYLLLMFVLATKEACTGDHP